jgi:hypothetical protein
MPGAAGGQDDDPEATTAEQDEESTLLHCLSMTFACILMITVLVLMLRFCRAHPAIMGRPAAGRRRVHRGSHRARLLWLRYHRPHHYLLREY